MRDKLLELKVFRSRNSEREGDPGEGMVVMVEALNTCVDYPEEVSRWFRSRWWSIPVVVVFVGLPAVWGCIMMIKGIREWMGWVESVQ